MALRVEEYLAGVDARDLLARLGAPSGPRSPAAVDARAARAAVEVLLRAGAMNPAPALLAAGAGGSLVAEADTGLRAQGLRPRWFALEQEPDALRAFARALPGVVGFLGSVGDLESSAREAQALQPLPPLFHGALVALQAGDWPDPGRALAHAAPVLAHGAPVAVLGAFEDPKPAALAALALDRFHRAEVRIAGPGWFVLDLER